MFFINELMNEKVTYAQLFNDLTKTKNLSKNVKINDNLYDYFRILIASIINQKEIEVCENLNSSGIEINILDHESNEEDKIRISFTNFHSLINSAKKWKIYLYTSGTTGKPKKIPHSVDSLTRFVSYANHKNDTWLLTYSPAHIAGLQVFFQALLNFNPIVYAYRYNKEIIYKIIKKYKVTHISGTTTFYRLILNTAEKFDSVKSLTFGGEKFDPELVSKLRKVFPNAKIKNIYASTEVGSLLISQNDIYKIPENFIDKIMFKQDELYVHKSLVADTSVLKNDSDWFATGDLIEIVKKDPLEFSIIGRKGDMVKVGGYRVNITEIEDVLNSHPLIQLCKIYSKKNSVIGNILIAEVVPVDKSVNEKQIKEFLRQKLPEYKIPRVIHIVDSINTTNSGKIKR